MVNSSLNLLEGVSKRAVMAARGRMYGYGINKWVKMGSKAIKGVGRLGKEGKEVQKALGMGIYGRAIRRRRGAGISGYSAFVKANFDKYYTPALKANGDSRTAMQKTAAAWKRLGARGKAPWTAKGSDLQVDVLGMWARRLGKKKNYHRIKGEDLGALYKRIMRTMKQK